MYRDGICCMYKDGICSVNDAIDAKTIKVTDCINGQLMKHKTQTYTAFRSKW